MEVGKLDRVADLLDLVVEPADVPVGDVGDLLEDQLVHLGARESLEHESGARVEQEMITRSQRSVRDFVGELGHPFLVGATHDDGAPLAGQELLERDHLARQLEAPSQDDVQRLVEHELLAAIELPELDLRVDGDAHLATGGEDVGRAVVVRGEERSVGRGRHREFLDLLPECRDVFACLAQGGRQLLVVGERLRELPFRLEQPLLQGAHALGGVLQTAAQEDDLFLERLDLRLEIADLSLVLAQPSLVLGGHRPTSRRGPAATLPRSFSGLAPSFADFAGRAVSLCPPTWISTVPVW